MFGIKKQPVVNQSSRSGDFAYLPESAIYFDSACQCLRPTVVTEAITDYYTTYNSCGERVKYAWGLKVDQMVDDTRAAVLNSLKLSGKKYFVSFTQNTTYGLNLLQSQLRPDGIKRVITSDIEHNSVFLSTMSLAKRLEVPRQVVTRRDDGSLDWGSLDFSGAVVVVNAVSNVDGRQLSNIRRLAKAVHEQGGLLIIDAAQTMAFYSDLIAGVEADAICFSAHKMYAPSLGVMVVRRDLLRRMDVSFIGGGMVDDVTESDYQLSADSDAHIHTAFEPGLQPYGEIAGLGAALKWLPGAKKRSRVNAYAEQLTNFLAGAKGIHLLNRKPGPIIAFYHDKIDSHLLAQALSDRGIMVRSGYFCVHHYLHHVKQYPPLVRLSLGLHNRQSDVDQFISAMEQVVR